MVFNSFCKIMVFCGTDRGAECGYTYLDKIVVDFGLFIEYVSGDIMLVM